jgi:MSHA biogenesis protein MshJ
MSRQLRQYAQRFDVLTPRERGVVAAALLVAVSFLWWSLYADPTMQQISILEAENQRISSEVGNSRGMIRDIRNRIAAGVHLEKEAQLTRLAGELSELEERLQVETVELVDPEKMFALMNQLIYRESRLKLSSLRRREVRPAIPVAKSEQGVAEPTIYRHVLEIELAGSYLDILRYMQSLEALDWKLLWDEIDIVSEEHPKLKVKLVMSTLSTRKEWVGI